MRSLSPQTPNSEKSLPVLPVKHCPDRLRPISASLPIQPRAEALRSYRQPFALTRGIDPVISVFEEITNQLCSCFEEIATPSACFISMRHILVSQFDVIVDEGRRSLLFYTLCGSLERFAARRKCSASSMSIVFTTYSPRTSAHTKANTNGRQRTLLCWCPEGCGDRRLIV